jgi:hypothetical protein
MNIRSYSGAYVIISVRERIYGRITGRGVLPNLRKVMKTTVASDSRTSNPWVAGSNPARRATRLLILTGKDFANEEPKSRLYIFWVC